MTKTRNALTAFTHSTTADTLRHTHPWQTRRADEGLHTHEKVEALPLDITPHVIRTTVRGAKFF